MTADRRPGDPAGQRLDVVQPEPEPVGGQAGRPGIGGEGHEPTAGTEQRHRARHVVRREGDHHVGGCPSHQRLPGAHAEGGGESRRVPQQHHGLPGAHPGEGRQHGRQLEVPAAVVVAVWHALTTLRPAGRAGLGVDEGWHGVRWCSFTSAAGGAPRLGAVAPSSGRVLDVGVWARSRDAETPVDLVDLVESSAATQERVTELVRSAPEDGAGWVRVEEVTWLAPLRAPNSLRDFMAFRSHVELASSRRGRPVPAAWDELPVFYKGNRRSVVGPGTDVAWPSFTERLDYECEVAAVVGRGGRDVAVGDAAAHVFGYTIMNDWSARDVQAREMSVGLGPAKGKDFATSLGPWVVTPDEWSPEDDHPMTVTVDGELWSSGSTAGRRWSFAEMLAWVSRDEDVWPTDILGSGTFGGGCGLDVDRWLQPGAVVTLAVDGLGELTNRVVRG